LIVICALLSGSGRYASCTWLSRPTTALKRNFLARGNKTDPKTVSQLDHRSSDAFRAGLEIARWRARVGHLEIISQRCCERRSRSSYLGENNSQDFACPQCESRYKLIREKAGPPTSNQPVRCRVCGHVLASREGEDILKYFLIFRRAAEPHWNAMAKLSMPAEAAAALRASERMLLFCVASNTDWKHPAIPSEIVNTMVVKGLIDRDAGGVLSLTDRGRAVLRAMLPEWG
jgi:predicted Zn finger-like uncharacterized protein